MSHQRRVMDKLRGEIADIAIELVGEWMCPSPDLTLRSILRQRLTDKVIAYEAAKRGHFQKESLSS